MIMGDMRTFGMIYSVMLFGFSQSFYFLYKGFPGVESSLYHSYFSTWMALFQITLGDYNVSPPSVTALYCHVRVLTASPSLSLISVHARAAPSSPPPSFRPFSSFTFCLPRSRAKRRSRKTLRAGSARAARFVIRFTTVDLEPSSATCRHITQNQFNQFAPVRAGERGGGVVKRPGAFSATRGRIPMNLGFQSRAISRRVKHTVPHHTFPSPLPFPQPAKLPVWTKLKI